MDVRLVDGRVVRCSDEPTHSGAEGELFFSQDGKFVIKLYLKDDPARRKTLEAIIHRYNAVRDDSYWQSYFCWPSGIAEEPRLGVMMPRAARGLRALSWHLLPRPRKILAQAENGDWSSHVTIAIQLSRAIRRMHQLGLCHSDLSLNNCLVNMVSPRLTLIDLDGLVVPGILPPQVSGTPEYMAPEIIAASAKPSLYTDLHSLAVLLYQILLLRHPLKGPKRHAELAEEDDRMTFGCGALYIEHPTDKSNWPRNRFVTSQILGRQLVELFHKVFVDGLHHPAERPQAAKWEEALVRLHDRLVSCVNPDCEGRYFPLIEQQRSVCPWCQTPWKPGVQVMFIDLFRPVSGRRGSYQFDNWSLAVMPDRAFYEWHIYPDRPPSPRSDRNMKARFAYSATRQQWRMRNESEQMMWVGQENSGWVELSPGEDAVLENHLRIQFSKSENTRIAAVRTAD